MLYIKKTLTAWGNSRRVTRFGTEYPFKAAMVEGAKRDADLRDFLNEDEAEIVDNAVLKLREINNEQHLVLLCVYVKKMSYRDIEKYSGMSQGYLNKNISNAESFVHGYLTSSFINSY